MRPTRVALYVRVSREEQAVENQEHALREYAHTKGYTIVGVFADETTDHGAPEESRTGFGSMMKAASARKFDVLLVFALDRLSRRGIGPVFTILGALKACGVGWESIKEPWATDSGPAAEILLAVLAWASQQERKRISERTRAALARKRAMGVRLGRPPGSKDGNPRTRRWAKRPAVGIRP